MQVAEGQLLLRDGDGRHAWLRPLHRAPPVALGLSNVASGRIEPPIDQTVDATYGIRTISSDQKLPMGSRPPALEPFFCVAGAGRDDLLSDGGQELRMSAATSGLRYA